MEKYAPFQRALPVWFEGMENGKNVTGGLYATAAGGGDAVLCVATSGFFRVFINGQFMHYGPARCAHGYFRVDEVPVKLREGVNHIAVDVVCYGISCFSSPLQPAFVQAELRIGENVVAATGAQGFETYLLTERVRKVQRYSFQRTFAESYRIEGDTNGWRMGRACANAVKTPCVAAGEKRLLPRRLALPQFPAAAPVRRESAGTFKDGVKPEEYWRDRSLTGVGDRYEGKVDGYAQDELELQLSDLLCEMKTASLEKDGSAYTGVTELEEGRFEILSLGCEKTGLIQAQISCRRAGTLYVMVDETLTGEEDVNPLRMGCVNAIRLEMQEGDLDFLAMEPLGFKYVKLACASGAFSVRGLCVREVICPQPVTARCAGDEPALRKIFDAARESFVQNSFDLFMDCPTRERAGWLCDSFFTARSERFFTGGSAVERNFLENFVLPDHFPGVEEGMIAMCYPSDHYDRVFIPNWAMWLVLELEEYRARTGDEALIAAFRPRIEALLAFFAAFENRDGLLERLSSWVFVEWSHANDLVQDINFPTNMLYARMLEAAAALYGDDALKEKAGRLHETIRARSFDGQFFRDNEVYRDGVPVSSGERTETCQYYAFFMGTATPESHPALWNTLLREFGPKRAEKGLWKEIWPSNAFIGNYLRLDLLRRYGAYEQLKEEMEGYFLYMAERTGTLWENATAYASCNHGFASYAAVLLDAAVREG